MRDPVTDLSARGRAIFAGVLLFAALHGLLYVITIPAWDLFDEEQHLSYALYLRDEQRIPEIDDPIQEEIIANAAATDRWERFRIGRPSSLDPGAIGLEGLSYEGYQPPLYYGLVAIATVPGSGDVWRELYLGRLLGIFLIFGMAGVTWGYARDWLPGASPAVWGSAVLIATGVPAMAAAAGRVNNDLLAALLVAAGMLMASRLLDDGRRDQALYLGLLAAAAILTKGHGAVLLPVVAVALFLLWRQGRLDRLIALAAALPGLVALAGWTLWTYGRYGTLTGSGAFLELVVPFEPLGARDFLEHMWLNAWSSYWGAYDAGALRVVTGLVMLVLLAGGIIGIVRGLLNQPRPASSQGDLEVVPYEASFFSRPQQASSVRMPGDAVLLTGTLGVGLLVVLLIANESGLAHPHGRMLLPAFPALATLVAGGWARLAGAGGAVAVAAVVAGLSIFYHLDWFYPFFHGDLL